MLRVGPWPCRTAERDHPRRLQLAGVSETRQLRLDGPDEQITRYVADNL